MNKFLLTILSAGILTAGLSFSAFAADFSIADGETLQFDFGSHEEDGWTKVSSSTKYFENKGYGFSRISNVLNDTASGERILSDCVITGNTSESRDVTFNVDLPEGMYEIGIYAGDIEQMNVSAEGYYIIMNMTGSNCYSSAEIPVTDGQLNISLSAFKKTSIYSLSALTITKIPSELPRKKRVFIGGDSITASYYPLEEQPPLEEGYQGGWGQMLKNYISPDLYVHNYATGGQWAQGFLKSGQFDAVINFMEEGDYFIVGYGINDQVESDEKEFTAAMTEMVQRTLNKGGIPIIITTQGRLDDFREDGLCYEPDRWYKNAAKRICDEYNICYIDLHDLAAAYFTEIGYSDTESLYWTNWSGEKDPLHVNRIGAGQMARLAAEELRRLNFNDFYSEKLLEYGISDDITLKCSGVYYDGLTKHVDFQNLCPSSRDISVIACGYDENGMLISARKIDLSLSPFDVLDTAAVTTLELSDNECAFMVKDTKLINLNKTDVSYVYDTPRLTADRILTNY